MIDHSNMKLGRKALVQDSRTLKMATYLTGSLPPNPPSIDWSKGVSEWGMMLNDQLGCCTIAGCCHAIQVWSLNSGKEITLGNDIVLQKYEQWDGYNPANPASDQGGVEIYVLNDWKNSDINGHKLDGYTGINVKNIDEVRTAIHLFGGVYIGISLPLSAQTQNEWDIVSPSSPQTIAGSWGGHCVYVCGYDQHGFTCITWGQLKKMTLGFWENYVDEAYALVGQDWFNQQGIAPDGFNLSQLQQDLMQIR